MNVNTLLQKITKHVWFLPLIGGIALAIAFYLFIPRPNAELQRIAAEAGYDVGEYELSKSLDERLVGENPLQAKQISKREFDELRGLLASKNPEMVMRNLGLLAKFRGTPFQAEATDLARKSLTAKDPWHVKSAALALKRLEAPDLAQIKQELLKHPDKEVQSYAANL